MIKSSENKCKNDVESKDINLKYKKWMRIVLRRAIDISKKEIPVSAIIIDDRGRCIGRGTNTRKINNNPLGHAELMALRQAAFIKSDWRFNDCIMFVNLEPCPMCAGAIIQARMGKLIFSALDKKRGALGGTIDLSRHKSSHHKMEVVGGIYEEESKKLIQNWFKNLRSQK